MPVQPKKAKKQGLNGFGEGKANGGSLSLFSALQYALEFPGSPSISGGRGLVDGALLFLVPSLLDN